MRAIGSSFVVAIVIASAACASDPSVTAPPSGTDTVAVEEVAPSSTDPDPVGVAELVVDLDDPMRADDVAAALTDALAGFDAGSVSIEGGVVSIRVRDITQDEAEAIEPVVEPAVSLTLRPVVLFDDAGEPGNDVLPTADGEELAVGPAQADETAFCRAEMVRTQNPEGFSVSIRTGDQAAWNALATDCFNGSVTCPGTGGQPGRLAIVVDGVIASAPTVYAPTFADII